MKHGRKDYQRIQDPAANQKLIAAYVTAKSVANEPYPTRDALIVLLAELEPMLEKLVEAPPEHPIGVDEPVFLLRAADKIAPSIVREYAQRLRQEGGGTWDHAAAVVEQAVAMEAWQGENHVKLPDAPSA